MRNRHFDYCIVDEASQLSLPACVGPIRLATRFILVGDHYQIAPLVRSKSCQDEQHQISLFEHLVNVYPSKVSMLRKQYRMNAEIMSLSNTLVYKGQLQCGNDQVRNWKIGLAGLPNASVIFIDTDSLDAVEKRAGQSFQNELEASVVKILAKLLCKTCQVAIISPYRPQLELLQVDYGGVHYISTIDCFQGRDSECVILSTVRSNKDGVIGEILSDRRRLNVAFSRAKKLFIIVGSRQTILEHKVFKNVKDLFCIVDASLIKKIQ